MSLMFQPLVKYADFEGRARRSEYWLFALFQALAVVAIIVVMAMVSALAGPADGNPRAAAFGPLLLILMIVGLLGALALFIPGLAVTVRRLHDGNNSGWWILLHFIPFGGFVVFIFTLMDGTPGPNKFGPDPKGRSYVGPVTEVHHYHHGAPAGFDSSPPTS